MAMRARPKNNGTRKDGKQCLVPCRARYRSAQQAIIHMLQWGKTDKEIIPIITEEYGYSERTVEDYICDAKKTVEKKFEKYAEGVGRRNKQRLEAMMEEAEQLGDGKLALECIKELNKMSGQYETKIKVEGNGDFKIKLNEK